MGATKPQLFEKASDIFTDREEPRRAFWNLYRGMKKGDVEIIHFYGTGGIGKTTLLKKLQSELGEAGISSYLCYSFENIKPKAEILADFARILGEKLPGIKFPFFEYAYLKYKQISGDDVDGLQEKHNKTIFDRERVGIVADVLSQFIPYGGLAYSALKGGARMSKKLSRKIIRSVGENSDIFEKIDNCSSVEILKDLQKYFAYDAYDYFEKQEIPFVIMLDGYEGLVNKLEKGDKAVSDDLWLRGEDGPVRSIPNVLWVIAGRERLDWGEDLLKHENTHLMGNLSEADSMEFFRKSGLCDEQLSKGLYELTLGTPVYMDLCIKTYNGIKARKGEHYQPTLEEFGHNTEELAARYLRDMSITEQNLVKLISCLPNIWNDKMVETMAERLKIDFSHGEYRLIKELSLVESDVNEPGYYKLHETFRKVVVARMDEDELGDMVPEVVSYLVNELYKMTGKEPEMYSRMKGCLAYFKQYSGYFGLTDFGAEALLGSMNLLSCYIEAQQSLDLMEEICEILGESIGEEEIYERQMVCWRTKMVGLLSEAEKHQEAIALAEENHERAKEVYEPNHVEILRAVLAYAKESLEDNDYARTDALCAEAFEIIKANSGIGLSEQLETLELYHANERQAGKPENLEGLAESRIALCLEAYHQEKEAFGENSESMPYYIGHLYRAYYDAGKYEEALRMTDENLRWYERAGESNLETLDVIYIHKIDCYFGMNDYENALAVIEEKYQKYKDMDGTDPFYVVSYCYKKEKCHIELQEYEKVLETCRLWYQVTCQHYGEKSDWTRDAKYHLAEALYRTKQYEEAAVFYRQVYEGCLEKYGEKSWEAICALRKLADALWNTDDDGEVEEMYQKVYQHAVETEGEDDIYALLVLGDLAWCYKYWEMYEQAEACYRKLFESYSRSAGMESDDAIWACMRRAGMLCELECYEEALPILEENTALMRGQEEPDKLVLAENLYYTGRCMQKKKEYEQAVACYKEAYSLYQQEEPENSVVTEVLYGLGFVSLMLRNDREAVDYFKKFLERMNAMEETEGWDYVRAKSMMGKAYYNMEEYETARELFAWCYEKDMELFGVNARPTLQDMLHYARLEHKMGNALVADELLNKHYELCVQEYGEADCNTIVCLYNFGNYYEETGRPERARELWEQALAFAQKTVSEDEEFLAEISETLRGRLMATNKSK